MNFELKGLKEKRGLIGAKIERILETVVNEKRAKSASEETDYLNLKAEYDALTAKISAVEANKPGAGIGREDTANRSSAATASTIRSTDSFAKHLRDNGETENRSGVSIGRMARALWSENLSDDERRALNEGTDASGGYTVPTLLSADFIDKLRAQSVVFRAGASTVNLSSKTTNVAKLTGDVTASWLAEAGTLTASDPTFGVVSFVPKKLTALVKASRELLEDSVNADAMIERSITNALSLAVDTAALYGTGSSNQPTGVANFSINSVSMATNGAALTNYAKILDAIYEVELDNSVVTGAIAHPRTIKALNALADSTGQPMQKPSALQALPFYSTTGVPINQTQGSSSVASSILMGNWSDLIIGFGSQLQIKRLEERYIDTDEIGFYASLHVDVHLAHDESFVKLVGVL